MICRSFPPPKHNNTAGLCCSQLHSCSFRSSSTLLCGSLAHLFFIKKKISMKAKLSLNGLRRYLANTFVKPIPGSAVIVLSQMEEEMEMLAVSREKSREVCLEGVFSVLGMTRLPELMEWGGSEGWGWKRLLPGCALPSEGFGDFMCGQGAFGGNSEGVCCENDPSPANPPSAPSKSGDIREFGLKVPCSTKEKLPGFFLRRQKVPKESRAAVLELKHQGSRLPGVI